MGPAEWATLVIAITVAWLVLVALHGRTPELRRRADRLLGKLLRVKASMNDNDPPQIGQGGSS